jgi:hypothetical protein
MLLLSLTGLLCLNPIRKREHVKPGIVNPDSIALST